MCCIPFAFIQKQMKSLSRMCLVYHKICNTEYSHHHHLPLHRQPQQRTRTTKPVPSEDA